MFIPHSQVQCPAGACGHNEAPPEHCLSLELMDSQQNCCQSDRQESTTWRNKIQYSAMQSIF